MNKLVIICAVLLGACSCGYHVAGKADATTAFCAIAMVVKNSNRKRLP